MTMLPADYEAELDELNNEVNALHEAWRDAQAEKNALLQTLHMIAEDTDDIEEAREWARAAIEEAGT